MIDSFTFLKKTNSTLYLGFAFLMAVDGTKQMDATSMMMENVDLAPDEVKLI